MHNAHETLYEWIDIGLLVDIGALSGIHFFINEPQ